MLRWLVPGRISMCLDNYEGSGIPIHQESNFRFNDSVSRKDFYGRRRFR
jgi:hypothetical protein